MEERPKNRKKKSKLKKARPFLLILTIVLAFGFFYLIDTWNQIGKSDFDASDVYINSDLDDSVITSQANYTTIALFGVDSRDNTTLTKGALADTNIIACINNKTHEIKLVSVYRDTYVENLEGGHQKINEVYNKYGALDQLGTLNKNFDLTITKYVTVNWKAVAETIDLMGGLDIELTELEASGINKYIDEVMSSTGLSSSYVTVQAGVQHLDGVQSVTYCRLRNTAGSDYKRTERQREVISLMLEAAKKMNVITLTKICNEIFPAIATNMSLTEILSLASSVSKYEISDSTGFPFNQASQSSGGRDYVYSKDLEADVISLHAYLYENNQYTPSGTVKRLSQEMDDAF